MTFKLPIEFSELANLLFSRAALRWRSESRKMNDFQILGLKPGATMGDAKAAWRRLARKNHPDSADDKEAAGRAMQEINAAYDRIKKGMPNMAGASSAAPGRSRDGFWRAASSSRARPDYPDFEGEARTQEERRKARTSSKSSQAEQNPHQAKPKPSDDGFEQRARGGSARAAKAFYAEARRKMQEDRNKSRAPKQDGQADEPSQPDPLRVLEATPEQRETMMQTLATRTRAEAFRRITELNNGIFPDPRRRIDTNRGDLPGFHMVEKATFLGRRVTLHVASAPKEGRNIVAMPEMSLLNGRTVRQGLGVRVFEVWARSGERDIPLKAEHNPVEQGQDLEVRVMFSSACVAA